MEVSELVQQLSEAQCSLDKCSREKMSVTAELEVARSQLNSVDVDYSKVPAALVVMTTHSEYVSSHITPCYHVMVSQTAYRK